LLWLRVKGRLELPFPTVFLLVCGAGLVLGGCADWSDDTLQQDVVRLRRDVNALMIAANRGRGESESLAQIEGRYRAQAAENERRTAQISGKLDSLSAELSELSARLDSLSQRIEDLGHPGQRLGAAPRSLRSSGVVPSPPSPAPPTLASPSERGRASATPSSGPTHGASTAQESYQAAYLDFSKGRYELAIQGFREFIHRFPDSPLADSAQYSIGESYFSLARASASAGNADRSKREMEQSVQEFRRVLVNYPRGSKVPTALYKEALALTELKQTTLAQARLQYLLDHFPQSEEAPLARESLAALKQ
jgi:tol-pal system protein YbgF